MSVRVMSLVWEDESLSATDKIVMLSLADHADDEGYCYPSISRLTRRTGLAERTVQNAVKRLKSDGKLHVNLNAGRGHSNLYRVTPTPASYAPPQQMHPAYDAPLPPHMTTQTPAADAPKPSRTINEPSVKSLRAKRIDPVLGILCEVHGVTEDAATSFIAYRKGHKSKAMSATAGDRLAVGLWEIYSKGGDPSDALGMAEEHGWATVKPEWYWNKKGTDNERDNGNTSSGRAGNARASGPHNSLMAGFADVANRYR